MLRYNDNSYIKCEYVGHSTLLVMLLHCTLPWILRWIALFQRNWCRNLVKWNWGFAHCCNMCIWFQHWLKHRCFCLWPRCRYLLDLCSIRSMNVSSRRRIHITPVHSLWCLVFLFSALYSSTFVRKLKIKLNSKFHARFCSVVKTALTLSFASAVDWYCCNSLLESKLCGSSWVQPKGTVQIWVFFYYCTCHAFVTRSVINLFLLKLLSCVISLLTNTMLEKLDFFRLNVSSF